MNFPLGDKLPLFHLNSTISLIVVIIVVIIFVVLLFYYRRHKMQDILLQHRKNISEDALEYKAGLEKILNNFSLALLETGSEGQFNRVVNTLLAQVGEYVCVDRLYIFLFSADHRDLENTNEWCAPGISSQKKRYKKLPPESIPWIISSLEKNDHVIIPDAGNLPVEARQEAAMFKRTGDHTMMMVPIRAKATLIGFIGFDFLDQPWMDEDVHLLHSLSNIIGLAIFRIRAEAKLLERGEKLMEYQERLKSLVIELTLAEERQRRKVADDLHDQIGQMLAVVRIKQKKLAVCDESTERSDLSEEIIEMLDQVLLDVRSLTFDLSALAVHRDDINAAIESLSNRILTNLSIKSTFRAEGESSTLPEHVRTILYQVVRELYYNIIKHAQAANVTTTISWHQNRIALQVIDDGVGFNTNKLAQHAKDGHFGLFNAQERVSSLQGSLIFYSTPGSGATADVSIPIPLTSE